MNAQSSLVVAGAAMPFADMMGTAWSVRIRLLAACAAAVLLPAAMAMAENVAPVVKPQAETTAAAESAVALANAPTAATPGAAATEAPSPAAAAATPKAGEATAAPTDTVPAEAPATPSPAAVTSRPAPVVEAPATPTHNAPAEPAPNTPTPAAEPAVGLADKPAPSPSIEQPAKLDEATAKVLAGALNQFGQTLLLDEAQRRPKETILLSPLSLGLALGMLAEGAEGESRKELDALLGIDALANSPQHLGRLSQRFTAASEGAQLQVASGLWVAKDLPLSAGYASRVQDAFEGRVAGVDFTDPLVLEEINDWFSQRTGGRIPKLIAQLDTSVQLVIGNALHFKGQWREAFDPARTNGAPFKGVAGVRNVPTMMKRFDGLAYWRSDTAQGVLLPFGLGDFEMRVILPNDGVDLVSLLKEPSAWQAPEGWAMKAVDLHLPRFTLDLGGSVRGALEALGLKTVWGAKANLTGISSEPLMVSETIHRVSLTVDETGAEAAAATAVVATRSAVLPVAIEFHVDRPFLIELRHADTGAIVVSAAIRQL